MKFYVSDFDEYHGFLYLMSEDDGQEVSVDIDEYYDMSAESWNAESVRMKAYETIVSAFGEESELVWEEE